jgi:hypothetical protein
MAFAPKKGVMKKGIKGGGLAPSKKMAAVEPDGDEGALPFKKGGKVGCKKK